MTKRRLDTVAPEVVEILDSVSHDSRRRVAIGIAEWVVDGVQPEGREVSNALEALRSGNYGESPTRIALEGLLERLDIVAWDVQDKIGVSTTEEDYGQAFFKARSVHALWFALSLDAEEAAYESAYEAEAATEDEEGLRQTVISLLNG